MQLVATIAKENGLSNAAAGRVLKTVVDTITKAVAKGDSVQIVGFGTFRQAKRAARKARNPATGATIKVPAAKVPRFKAGIGFKDAVAGKRK